MTRSSSAEGEGVNPPVRQARAILRWTPLLFTAPLALVLLGFFVWPLLQSIVNSFHTYSLSGIDRSVWTLENYEKLFESFYLGVLGRTIRVSLMTSAITAVLAFPIAWYIAGRPGRAQAFWLMLFVAPWLVNTAVKAFGWTLILGPNGVVNSSLRAIGVIDRPLMLMFNETGIVIGLVHGHFMFVLLPLWAGLASFDRSLIWAARNLGSNWADVFTKVVFPLTLPALLAGMIINFTMNMAAFATPALLGGSRARVMSYLAYEVNLVDLNWPFGAAMAVLLLVTTMSLIQFSHYATTSGKRKVIFE
ncbi:ABC transporter permease [Pikeienuella piscinae]|uniref:ABC transporter permease n=1 Tax=Pikeienuella piscinae TaxID=2748098 RepID=A0A7L5C0L2_9RHOB|nr:ABC transporter permease [Pikeienuella piscinae]QIE56056.1 ABC transporter permease [Pikeienuella piscinae]